MQLYVLRGVGSRWYKRSTKGQSVVMERIGKVDLSGDFIASDGGAGKTRHVRAFTHKEFDIKFSKE